jgi:hypothetical protein
MKFFALWCALFWKNLTVKYQWFCINSSLLPTGRIAYSSGACTIALFLLSLMSAVFRADTTRSKATGSRCRSKPPVSA